MRGDAERQANMLLAVTPDSFIPEEHPIRRIKPIVERVLARLSPLFDGMYAERGRPSIPPAHDLGADAAAPTIESGGMGARSARTGRAA